MDGQFSAGTPRLHAEQHDCGESPPRSPRLSVSVEVGYQHMCDGSMGTGTRISRSGGPPMLVCQRPEHRLWSAGASALHAMVTTFEVDQLVVVAERQWPGVNKEGGDARVVKVHDDNTVGVKYIINNRSEASVHVKVRSRRSSLLDLFDPVRP